MINYEKIMKVLPVQKFIKSNFNQNFIAYKYYLISVKCTISESFISFPTIDGSFYLGLSNKPYVAYHAVDINNDWAFELNDIQSNSDLFNMHIKQDMFGMDYKFCEYLKEVNAQVLKEFYPWKK